MITTVHTPVMRFVVALERMHTRLLNFIGNCLMLTIAIATVMEAMYVAYSVTSALHG